MSDIDKGWIDNNNRALREYISGVDSFLEFAYSSKPGEEKILCPCRDCSNRYYQDRETVRIHCIVVGFEKWYTKWTSHGEEYINVHVPHDQNNMFGQESIQRDTHDHIRRMVHEGLDIPSMDEQTPDRYILFNTEAIEPYIQIHLSHLKRTIPRSQAHRKQTEHNLNFDTWFRDYVCTTNDVIPEDVKLLGLGPHMDAKRFKGYFINGFCFRIKEIDLHRKSQNSGVMLSASVMSFASSKDNNHVSGDLNYYGELIDIIELRYSNSLKYTLFKCNWVDHRTGIVKDPFKFTLVNFKHVLYKENWVSDEPFILATQAEQVWYVQDPLETDWSVVMRMTARDNFDVYTTEESTNSTLIPQVHPFNMQDFDENLTNNEYTWVREGVEGTEVDSAYQGDNDAEMDDEE